MDIMEQKPQFKPENRNFYPEQKKESHRVD